jgi:CRISPR-associated endonuclease/helicase Cas3
LKRAEQGQQVLWIENTVAEAQAIFKKLASCDIAIDVGLLHSRFLKTDRADNENYWVELYGKDNAQERQAKGRILVGTQVLEQSLDIDADFLVSRFAPTDMLLQRMGRLWRHEKLWQSVNMPRHATAKQREVWLLVPELNAVIENIHLFGNSAKVYSPYVLCRSLEVWHELKTVALPNQIRELIEASYLERDEAGMMQCYKAELDRKRTELNQLARFGLSTAGTTLPESASTRYSEQDTVQVLLLSGYQYCADKAGTELTLLNNKKIFLPRARGMKTQDTQQWRELAAILLQNTVQVADYLAPQAVSINDLGWLKAYFYLGDSAYGESLLRVVIVDESGTIKGLVGGVASDKYQLSYDKSLGYQAKKTGAA